MTRVAVAHGLQRWSTRGEPTRRQSHLLQPVPRRARAPSHLLTPTRSFLYRRMRVSFTGAHRCIRGVNCPAIERDGCFGSNMPQTSSAPCVSGKYVFNSLQRRSRSSASTDMTRPPAIHVAAIRKTYGQTVAVDEVSFEVEPGEIFGFDRSERLCSEKLVRHNFDASRRTTAPWGWRDRSRAAAPRGPHNTSPPILPGVASAPRSRRPRAGHQASPSACHHC